MKMKVKKSAVLLAPVVAAASFVTSFAMFTGGADAAALPTLRAGSHGATVKQLQNDLNVEGYKAGTPDGSFGSQTRSAVIRFQAAHHLVRDGVVGSNTWSIILGALPKKPEPKPASSSNIVNPNQTYTYTRMVSDLAELQQKYPDLIHATTLPQKTEFGRSVYAVGVGKGSATALVTGSFHAREWITTTLNMYMIDQYAQAYTKGTSIDGYNVRKLLTNTTLYFVPMMNPDGVTLEQSGAGAFPASDREHLYLMNNKSWNFSDWKANGQGIDLNRQYNGNWANIWYANPNGPWLENYKGTAPYQTAETQDLLGLIQQINPQMVTTYHASGRVIYWEYRTSGSQLSADRVDANAIRNMTGYSLIFPTWNASGGGLTDWWTGTAHRPGFTIEVGTYEGSRPVPVSQFSSIWAQNKAVGLYMAQQSASLAKHNPSINVPKLTGGAYKLPQSNG